MLRASAMMYALAVSLLIGLICSGLLMYAWYNVQSFEVLSQERQLMLNANSGVQLMLSNTSSHQSNASQVVDLFGDGNDSVSLSKRPWGAFEIITSTAIHRGELFEKRCLVGSSAATTEKPLGLYLANMNRPLKVCGKTEIRGTSFLPKAGIERAYIEGQTYNGEALHYGTKKESQGRLPELSQAFIQHNQDYLSGEQNPLDSAVSFYSFSKDSIQHSFGHRTILCDEKEAIALNHGRFEGNMIFRSKQRIFVGSEAQLENVILYAPEIIFEDGFYGQVQAYASESITTGNNCTFSYPSVLAVFHEQKEDGEASIGMGEQNVLEGIVIAHQQSVGPRFQPLIQVGLESHISGQVYSSGLTELKGIVHGSLYTQKFTLKTNSGIYENHLLNAVIDGEAISKNLAGCDLVNAPTNQTIIDWL